MLIVGQLLWQSYAPYLHLIQVGTYLGPQSQHWKRKFCHLGVELYRICASMLIHGSNREAATHLDAVTRCLDLAIPAKDLSFLKTQKNTSGY